MDEKETGDGLKVVHFMMVLSFVLECTCAVLDCMCTVLERVLFWSVCVLFRCLHARF